MVVSKQELIDLVEQINSKFDQIFKRLDDLEEFNNNCSCGKVKSTGRKKANA